MHAALKSYYEPDFESREVKVGGFVADIVGENGIIEIQTRGFDRLRRKLDAFLKAARVTVVYPVVPKRGLCWVDPETGVYSSTPMWTVSLYSPTEEKLYYALVDCETGDFSFYSQSSGDINL